MIEKIKNQKSKIKITIQNLKLRANEISFHNFSLFPSKTRLASGGTFHFSLPTEGRING